MTRTDVDALARLLDGDPTLNGEATEETRALGQLAHVLAQARTAPAPRPEFKAELRATLVEAARDRAARVPLHARARAAVGAATAKVRHSTRVAAATGMAALALSGGGVAVAASHAQPSDALYPAKLVMEDVRIALVRDGAARGEAHLAQASTRIAEAEDAAAAGNQAGAAVALAEADDAVRSGASQLLRVYQERGETRSVERLADFTAQQRAHLESFDGMLDGDAAAAAQALAVALERIDVRMRMVTGGCPGCAGGAPGTGDGFDFTHIPPAGEGFEPCPCEFGPSGEPGSPTDTDTAPPADGEAPDGPPVAEPDAPPADPPEPETPVVPPPAAEQPGDDVPASDPRDGDHEVPLPEVREPLRDTTDTLIDSVIRGLIDTADTLLP